MNNDDHTAISCECYIYNITNSMYICQYNMSIVQYTVQSVPQVSVSKSIYYPRGRVCVGGTCDRAFDQVADKIDADHDQQFARAHYKARAPFVILDI